MKPFVVSKVGLLVFLWTLSVFSTFINIIKIYPIFFLLFTLCYFSLNLVGSILLNRRIFLTILCIATLITIASISAIKGEMEYDFFSLKDNVKMILNYLWLVSSMCFFYQNHRQIANFAHLFKFTYILIFSLSLVALFYKIQFLSLWTTPFDGSNTSSVTSTVLNNIPTPFGDSNKNIFSTKVLLIVIITIVLHLKGFFEIRFFKLYICLSILFCIYSLSRTGQVVYFGFWVMLGFKRIMEIRSFKIFVPFLFTIGLLLTFFLGQIAIQHFFHIDINSDKDGLAARIILWAAYIKNIHLVGFFGNGIFSAGELIATISNRHENNFHNVFINLSYEIGWIGLLVYIIILILIFFFPSKQFSLKNSLILFIPFLICINSHYAGYGSDEVIYLANSFYVFLGLGLHTSNNITDD